MHEFFKIFALLFCISLGGPASAQDRFDSGRYKGFIKSPTEQVIVELERPFEVRSIRGLITDHIGYPMPDVLFEVRNPTTGKVFTTHTDHHGRFKMSSLPAGTYSFKARRSGFQSVTGRIVVSKKADRKAIIKIEMPLGV